MEKINYKYVSIGLATLLIANVAWNYNDRNDMDNMNMGSMTMDQMSADLKGKSGRDLEKAFITGMIPHHQGAVDMAKVLLQDKTISPKFVKFANDIIKAQEGEIKMMNEWAKGY